MGFCGFPIRNSSETIICCNLKISTCLRLHRFFNVKLRGPPQRFRSPPSANRRSSVSTSLAAKWGSWESLALETVFKGITGDVEMIGQQPSCYMQNCYNHHPHHQSTLWKANIKMQKQLFEDAFPITNGGFSSHRHGFIPQNSHPIIDQGTALQPSRLQQFHSLQDTLQGTKITTSRIPRVPWHATTGDEIHESYCLVNDGILNSWFMK